MASFQRLSFLLIFCPVLLIGQYTDVINSNRPGLSVSAYAVGKNVVQAEFGVLYEQQDHSILNTTSTILGSDLALRYGFMFETLEISYEGTFIKQDLTFSNFGIDQTRTDFTRNRLGIKYLVYDPFKNPEANKPNIRSWKANHKFQFKNLLPAVSIYGGATFNLGDNPFYPEDATISYRGMVAAQSRLTPRWVLITNVAYDRITTDFPELSYIISVSHALRNPKWSLFVEHQGIDSDRYADALLRGGIAHLFGTNFQADVSFGGSVKTTPSRTFITGGVSYRLDFHKDELKPIDDQKPTTKIKRKDVKRKKRKKKDKIDF
ncbi:MAG: transporter [Croceitalea sp.]|nr:transporter [Croceitalea sp.]MBT8237785.1 transporter [Croceitalea sp.]NNC35527.1 transporter [Croceitalea sp.]NNL09504.1 transporter [Croceitalea sp.]NNM18238.1 transporter [Croceitalea sp.]